MKKHLPILLFTLFFIFSSDVKAQQSLQAGGKPPMVSCFPNPATSFITFSFENKYEKGYSIHIYNFLGKKMYERIVDNPQTKVELNTFNKGLYIYQVFDRNGKVLESGKFQLSR